MERPLKNCEKFEKIIESLGGTRHSLLLHVCCAPCASAVLERLENFFGLSIFFFNPNIFPESENARRKAELEGFLQKTSRKIPFVEAENFRKDFLSAVQGFEGENEGGERCFRCYALRIEKTAQVAAERGFDYFCTTLSVSPLKNAQKINEIGENAAKKFGVRWLFSDFKKKNGFLRSVRLSKEYGLYRQNYCGCEFSLKKNAEKSQP